MRELFAETAMGERGRATPRDEGAQGGRRRAARALRVACGGARCARLGDRADALGRAREPQPRAPELGARPPLLLAAAGGAAARTVRVGAEPAV
ncbi:MAG: hypothetical protein AAFY08_16550, partial [Planctomycetota bacterium]